MSHHQRSFSESTSGGAGNESSGNQSFDSTAGVAVAVSVGVVAAVAFSTIVYKEYRKKKNESKAFTRVNPDKLEEGLPLESYTTNESVVTFASTTPLQKPREAKVNKYPVRK